MIHTVYKITNLINEKIYIGVHAVKNLECDDGYMGSGLQIKCAVKKYGKENFKKEILVSFEDEEAAYLAESLVVDEVFVARADTYNMKCGGIGAGSGEKNSFYGKHHSDETKRKQAEIKMGKKPSEETKIKMSDAQRGVRNPNYGKKASKETKSKISEAHNGMKPSEETKIKMSDAKRGMNHPLYGKKHSEESKNKMSAAKQAMPILECPHCGKQGKGGNMKRWHFHNCKSKEAKNAKI